MQLELNVNDFKASILLEFLEIFKKDDMIKDYKIIDGKTSTYDDEVLSDISMIGDAIEDAKNGLGDKTSMKVTIQDA